MSNKYKFISSNKLDKEHINKVLNSEFDSKFWFEDVQYVENVINKFRRHQNYRIQVKAMKIDLDECVNSLVFGYRGIKIEIKKKIRDKLDSLKEAARNLEEKIEND